MTREEAINRFKGIRKSFSISIAQSKFYPSKAILNDLCDMAIEALQAEPVKHGEWEDIGGVIRYGCPFCHHAQEEKSEYCPNCGAKMDKGGDTE